MAHYYGTVQGSKGPTSRCGSKNSALVTEALSWTLGGIVKLEYDTSLKTDILHFYTTTDNGSTKSLAMSFMYKDGKLECLQTSYPEILL